MAADNPVKDGISRSAFIYAIAQQESGNYAAVNPLTGALGKYQVLPSNVAAWTKRALGYSLTPRQFLESPSAQEKTVQTVLGGYFDKYGPAGAASAWYSGNPNLANDTRPQRGGPSIAAYVQSVLGKARAAMKHKGGGGGGIVSTIESAAGDVVKAAVSPVSLVTSWDPLGFLGSTVKKETAVIITSVERLTIQALFVAIGVGVIVVGSYVAFKPAVDDLDAEVTAKAGDAAKVAEVAA